MGQSTSVRYKSRLAIIPWLNEDPLFTCSTNKQHIWLPDHCSKSHKLKRAAITLCRPGDKGPNDEIKQGKIIWTVLMISGIVWESLKVGPELFWAVWASLRCWNKASPRACSKVIQRSFGSLHNPNPRWYHLELAEIIWIYLIIRRYLQACVLKATWYGGRCNKLPFDLMILVDSRSCCSLITWQLPMLSLSDAWANTIQALHLCTLARKFSSKEHCIISAFPAKALGKPWFGGNLQKCLDVQKNWLCTFIRFLEYFRARFIAFFLLLQRKL